MPKFQPEHQQYGVTVQQILRKTLSNSTRSEIVVFQKMSKAIKIRKRFTTTPVKKIVNYNSMDIKKL